MEKTIKVLQTDIHIPHAGVPVCAGPLPERIPSLSRELPICVGVCPHISREDSGGRVCHCHVTEGHTESDIHHSHQGELISVGWSSTCNIYT